MWGFTGCEVPLARDWKPSAGCNEQTISARGGGWRAGSYCHTLVAVRFEWDPKKAAANLAKHGVSFDEAKTAFDDELGAYYPDTLDEQRFILIGYSQRQRLLYVVHAEVTADAIRIISARKATKREKAHYEDD